MTSRENWPDRTDGVRLSLQSWVVLGTVAGVILFGAAVGRMTTGAGVRAAATDPDATATRSAELAELDRLRTQVAQTVVCTVPPSPTETVVPSPTATATPVPPAAAGQPLPYADDWTVVVNAITLAPAAPDYTPAGKLVQVDVTVTNNGAEGRPLGFTDWILVDDQGRTFEMTGIPTTQLYGASWYLPVTPSLPERYVIVFDVALDAGPAFVLESRKDPTFRVAVQLKLLG